MRSKISSSSFSALARRETRCGGAVEFRWARREWWFQYRDIADRAGAPGFDFGFTEAGNAQFACEEAFVAGNFCEARADFLFRKWILVRAERREATRRCGRRLQATAQERCRANLEGRGAFGDHGLASIYFRHGAAKRRKRSWISRTMVSSRCSLRPRFRQRFRACGRRPWGPGRRRR